MKQRGDVKRAESRLEETQEEYHDLEIELEAILAETLAEYLPANLKLEQEKIAPYKKDIQVTQIALLWLAKTND